MSIARPNLQTRFPKVLQALLTDREAQYVLMDIGARGGEWAYLRPLASLADTIGFEPDPIECARLNAAFADAGRARMKVHPRALAGRTGAHAFFETQYPFSSGLHRGDEAWLDRFPFTTLKVAREIEIEAVTLDDFCAEAALDHVDFMKIDVEGAEFDVLDGARTMLRAQNVLGIFTEFWWDPVIKGQRSFADLDTLARAQGFRFFDLALHRYPRASLPAGRLASRPDALGRVSVVQAIDPQYGQAWTGDALYFRDPVGELRAGRLDPAWSRDMLLRLCGLYDVFDYGDCAIETLETFRSTLLADVDVDSLIDALVPDLAGRVMSYDVYRDLSVQIRQNVNLQFYGLSDWRPPMTGYRPKT